MISYRTSIAATLAILTAALLAPGRAEAGASASAASKNTHATQVASGAQLRTDRQARREVGITEYSSSSAKSHSQQH
jgi:hypothetical protein